MQEISHTLRVLPIHVIHSRGDKEESVNSGEELESLINTLGGEIVDRVIQRFDKISQMAFLGKGKTESIAEVVEKKEIDVVVINALLKPGQIHALKLAFEKANPKIEVWDRVDLILHIFEKHAKTAEANLQIELARMRYMGPRIYGMGHVLSRQGGGIGTVGIGETNTELMRRHWRNEIKKVEDELAKISKNRENQLEQRKKAGFKTVSIVGYTNAGKSSLFNILTNKKNYVKNELFATLDSSIGKIYIPELGSEVLITDTIGFIRDLPPTLVKAFKSTLMESIHADLLLHVVDASDHEVSKKITVVDDILHELNLKQEKIIYVFNKCDAISEEKIEELKERFHAFNPIFISVKKEEGIESVLERIKNKLASTEASTFIAH
ncbi:MAG TPA: GTPase HflX [Candidatus Levybacteria bacterium]|mgnify:CR=1 FL=1|nr:GTPase HflX [Candidatus Levybacteria bacterium]